MENEPGVLLATVRFLPVAEINAGVSRVEGHTYIQHAALSIQRVGILEALLTVKDIDVNAGPQSANAACTSTTPTNCIICRNPERHITGPLTPGFTALRLAVEAANVEGVTAILKAPNVDVNIADVDGVTPLLRAVQLGCVDAVEALARHHSIDLNVQDKRGNSALHYVNMLFGREKMVRLLLSLDIDINMKNAAGVTALERAVQLNRVKVVQSLRDHLRRLEAR